MEAGLDYDPKKLPSAEDYAKMLEASPILLAGQVNKRAWCGCGLGGEEAEACG